MEEGSEYRYQIRKEGPEIGLKTFILDLPLVYEGRWTGCLAFAKRNGWEWKNDRQLLFGGYWLDKEGNAFYPT